ncbi:MAG: hypothetical protein ACLP7Q_08165 [Isosphaeraceae bacterium]
MSEIRERLKEIVGNLTGTRDLLYSHHQKGPLEDLYDETVKLALVCGELVTRLETVEARLSITPAKAGSIEPTGED